MLCVIANIETFSQLCAPLLVGSVYTATVKTPVPGAAFFVCGLVAAIAFLLARTLRPTTYRYREGDETSYLEGGTPQLLDREDSGGSGFLRVPPAAKG